MSVLTHAQEVISPRTIKWQAPRQYTPQDYLNNGEAVSLLSFDQAIYTTQSQHLPVYSERIPLAGQKQGRPLITLTNVTYSELPQAEQSLIRQSLPEDIEVNAWKQIERHTTFVRYEFMPIRKNPGNGQIERVTGFTPKLNWDQEVDSTRVKSSTGTTFSNQSILSSGNWFKVAVNQSGIHKITYDQLIQMGFENPDQIRVYGNGGKQLPFDSSLPREDDLIQNPVYIYKGNDGVFNSGDYFLFYAKGPIHWTYSSNHNMFVHRLHQFSDLSYYFLSDNAGAFKQLNTASAINAPADQQSSSYDFYLHREKDSLNLLKSGRQWCWRHFSQELTWGFSLQIDNKIAEEPIHLLSSLWVRSSKRSPASKFIINLDETAVGTVDFPGVNTSNYEALFASALTRKIEIETAKSEFKLDYYFARSNPAAQAWLDYFDINTRSQLRYQNRPMTFRDLRTVKDQSITEFSVTNARNGLFLWDVSTLDQVQAIPHTLAGSVLRFKVTTDELREFILFNPIDESIPTVISEGGATGPVANQNLHGLTTPEMVILVQDDLREYAEELALHHQQYDQIESLVISPELIYNEFSSGIPDVTAIRDFLQMFYSRRGETIKDLKYLLLFGDGSFDNRKAIDDPSFSSCLPTYQSHESLYPTRSYVTDDFFGLLDTGEMLETGLMDIGIGRFPVRSAIEAEIILEKVKHYNSSETIGDWRNLICFIGDDEDGNAHMRDANTLAEIIDQNYPEFNLDKIFLDAYQQIVTATGETYPEVNRAINDRIKKGALIMNYLGHGSEVGLAHEDILTVSDIRSWDNADKLPLFMTATCEFSRFDDTSPSAGEWVLLNPQGGGIGLFTTTRLVYSSPNFRLNREFYEYAFEKKNGRKYRFGDIIRLTKNAVGSELNKLNFALLGDPALSLNYPELKIVMTHVNDELVSNFNDTLKALSEVRVGGYVARDDGSLIEDYQGVVYPTVFDKEVIYTNLSNDGGPIMEFTLQKNILFKGKSSVSDGRFNFNFLMPKDIGYNVGKGKFSFYGSDGTQDGSGVNLGILIGGSSDSTYTDKVGPTIRLFMNDTTFAYGGITNENPVFLAKVRDEQGINTTGNGIGHDITAIIDDNKQDVLVLNDYYESDLDSYQAGTIRYPINELEPGSHTLKLKVWDNLNNSSESEIRFEVHAESQVQLKNLLNYPNPFTTHTDFYFEHNYGGQDMDVQVQVFTVSGRLVKSFNYLTATGNPAEAGRFRVGPITWDGLDDFGDRIGRGTYIYRVKIRTPNGITKEAFQKLVKL